MTIIQALLRNRTVQLWALLAVGSAALISIGVAYDLNKAEWSGWAQALGAFVAIIASGRIATAQSRRQFEDARRLQTMDRAHQAFRVAKATSVIADRVGRILFLVIKQFNWNSTTFHLIATGQKGFDRNLLLEMRADLEAMPLHEIPSSRLIQELLLMRSAVRQLTEKIDSAFAKHRTMTANDFITFFNTLDDGHKQISLYIIRIELITRGLKTEFSA